MLVFVVASIEGVVATTVPVTIGLVVPGLSALNLSEEGVGAVGGTTAGGCDAGERPGNDGLTRVGPSDGVDGLPKGVSLKIVSPGPPSVPPNVGAVRFNGDRSPPRVLSRRSLLRKATFKASNASCLTSSVWGSTIKFSLATCLPAWDAIFLNLVLMLSSVTLPGVINGILVALTPGGSIDCNPLGSGPSTLVTTCISFA